MSQASDADILNALGMLEDRIQEGISQVEGVMADLKNHEDFQDLRQEIIQAQQILQAAHHSLEQIHAQSYQGSQELRAMLERASEQKILLDRVCDEGRNLYTHLESNQVLPNLNSILIRTTEQKMLLEQAYGEAKDLYTELKSESEQQSSYLENLTTLIEICQQHQIELDTSIQRAQSVKNLLLALDKKYGLDHLLEMKNHLEELLNQRSDYGSIRDLVIAIRSATSRLQEEQTQFQAMFEDMAWMRRRIEDLTQVQRTPWWWPTNWWWKPKTGVVARHHQHRG